VLNRKCAVAERNVRRLFTAVLYDTIGTGYASRRLPDPRISTALSRALGDALSVANVGAGSGSYEPSDRFVVAIEPSMTMIRQRPIGSAPAVQAQAESLPLLNGCVSAATAILTVHHWADRAQGLQELGRIARDQIVILTWDPAGPEFWLTAEYFPALVARDRQRFPGMEEISSALGRVSAHTVPVPHDCIDGFLGAYWRRPSAYLDPAVRSSMSGFASMPGFEEGLGRLTHDLQTGEWERRFGHLLRQDSLDVGYRLVVTRKH
jgi:SAM-dependent methyltransferase